MTTTGYPTPPRKRHTARKILLAAAALIVLIIIISAVTGNGGTTPTAGTTPPPAASPAIGDGCSRTGDISTAGDGTPIICTDGSWGSLADAMQQADASSAPPAPTYTVPQQQAIDSAESYLSDGTGFSRAGLISQLDSHYGEQFTPRLARFAVSHIRVSWRHQAVLSARNYLNSGQSFSYAGLVDQLHSPYGEGFTLSQAEYAAHKVGL